MIDCYYVKVYGKVVVGVLLMLVLYLDICFVDGKCLLLFGLFVGFLFKFLKIGLYMDLIKLVKLNNIVMMLFVGIKEMSFMKYLVL